jgi:hypothetical protein
MSYYNPPMEVGEYTTSTALSGDLKKTYRLNAGVFRWVTNTAAITNAGGKVLTHVFSSGAMTGQVAETTTANDYDVAGVVPLGTVGQNGTIAATTTLAANSYFLIQLSGQSQILANTTVTGGYALITTTTSGQAGSLSTTIDGANAVLGFLGYSTNTAVVTAAGNLITCVLTRVA